MQQLIKDVGENFELYYHKFVDVLPKLMVGLIVLTVIWLVANSIKRGFRKRLAHRLEDPLLAGFLARAIGIVIKIIGILIFMKIIGLGTSVAAFLGAASVGTFVIGFALKDIGEHFLAGIMLAFNRPFRVGDVVAINGITGKILEVSLRNTHLKTFDGKDVYVPNGNFIKNPLFNFTIDGHLRYNLEVGVAYNANAEKAMNIIEDIIRTEPGVILDSREPTVFITRLDNSDVKINMYYWLNPLDKSISSLNIQSNILRRIKGALQAANIEIPYNILHVIQEEAQQ
ncbi:MAG: mechanosensitive ion channel family protein [Bacteroidia bacterium]|nr:mechanosensitive ion channel family protein [Bacteroidia bacterium]